MISFQMNVEFTNLYKSAEFKPTSKKHVVSLDKAVLEEFVQDVTQYEGGRLMAIETISDKIEEWKTMIADNKCEASVNFVQCGNYMPKGMINRYKYKIQRLEVCVYTNDDDSYLYLNGAMHLTRVEEDANNKAMKKKVKEQNLKRKVPAGAAAAPVEEESKAHSVVPSKKPRKQ